MSLLVIVAIGTYAVTAALCSLAFGLDARAVQGRSGRRIWAGGALLFLALALIRLLDFEEKSRSAIRHYVQSAGQYGDRAAFQLPLAAIILAAIFGILWVCWRKWPGRNARSSSRLRYFAMLAMLGFGPLYALRLVSFHATDRLLYSGPLRLNWIADGALTLMVAVCASLYIRRIYARRKGR